MKGRRLHPIQFLMITLILASILIPTALIVAQSYDLNLDSDGDPKVSGCTTDPCPNPRCRFNFSPQ